MNEITTTEATTEATTAATVPFAVAPKTTADKVRDFIATQRQQFATPQPEGSKREFAQKTANAVLNQLEEATKPSRNDETPREPLTRSETMKEVKKAYHALQILNNFTWTSYRDELYKMCAEEEKGHRNFVGRDTRPAITTPDAAKLFTVRRITEYLTGELKEPEARYYITMQKSCFYAASIVANYRSEIAAAFHAEGINVETLLSADYARLVDPETK